MSQLNVEIVAADRLVWRGEANRVSARSAEGELGILPGHQPLLGLLVGGEIRVETTDNQKHSATVDEGFLSVDHNHVTIVAEHVNDSNFGS